MNWSVKSIKRFAQLQIILNTFLFQLLQLDGCISISTFTFLIGIPIGIMSPVIELKTCAITTKMKKYKSIIKKKKKKHDKIVLLAKI